jgi:His-Xaa-Ser system protein HxsD
MGDYTSNILVNPKKRLIEIKINTEIYPLEAVYSAAYVFLDKAYVFLKGDPKGEITAEIRPKQEIKNEIGMEEFGMEFNSQLLNYTTYKQYSDKNIEVKKMLMHEIFTNIKGDNLPINAEEKVSVANYKDIEIDDPDGILIPWEEKYGKKKPR